MYTKKLLLELLQIQNPWYIKSVNFNKKQLTIEIDFKRGSTFEDNDNGNDASKAYKVYDTRIKTWKHLDILQYPCFIKARVPRVQRDDGRVRLISPCMGRIDEWSYIII